MYSNLSPNSFSTQYKWILAEQPVHTSPYMNETNYTKTVYMRKAEKKVNKLIDAQLSKIL